MRHGIDNHVYNEADLLHLYSQQVPEADQIQSLYVFRDLVTTIASLSSLIVFRNDLLSSGVANQISSRLGVGTEQMRTPVSIADGCFRFVRASHGATYLSKNGVTLISATLNFLTPHTRKLLSTHVPGSSNLPIWTVPLQCHILIAVLRT